MDKCIYCDEDIDVSKGDRFKTNPDGSNPVHIECAIRMIVGSVGHQRKECSCHGLEDISEIGQSLRQAAQTAYVYYFYTAKSNSEKVNRVQAILKKDWN